MLVKKIKSKIHSAIEKSTVLFGLGVECNVCGNKVSNFDSDEWHQHIICRKCGSQIRHRLLIAAINHLKEFDGGAIFSNKIILHFAPDKCLRSYIEKSAAKYLTADFMAPGYHYENIQHNLDISNMSSIQTNSIDTLIALDVLEHVPKHTVALNEIFRVLKPGGYCILTIPQKDGLEKTFEDEKITSQEDRKKYYGQWDHLRIYGSDFKDLLNNAGFKVSIIDEKNFSKKLVKKHVLFPLVLSNNPLATNYRKVYFGKKPE